MTEVVLRVAAIEHFPLYRKGLRHALARKTLSFVGHGSCAADLHRVVEKLKPHILLLEIAAPGDVLGEARVVMSAHPGMKVVVLTASDKMSDVAKALNAGVHGYILKGIAERELISALTNIYHGQPYISNELASRLVMEGKGAPLPKAPNIPEAFKLTSREKQIVLELMGGRTNQEIAQNLGLKVTTLKYYLVTVFKKLNVKNRVEAVMKVNRF